MFNLKDKPDDYLVKQIKTDSEISNECIKVLSDRHGGMYRETVNKYLKSSGIYNLSDAYNDRDFMVYQTAKSFDENKKTKFSTFFCHTVRWKLQNKIKKEKGVVQEPIDGFFDLVGSEDVVKDAEIESLKEFSIDVLSKSKNPNLKEVFELYYLEGYSITEIANILGKSKQLIDLWLKNSKKEINKKLRVKI